MKISSFKIENYKSIINSGELKLASGFNVVVGKNNVGKTALLDALSLRYVGKSHRSVKSKSKVTSALNPISPAEVVIAINGDEVKDIILNNFSQINVPVEEECADESSARKCLEYFFEETVELMIGLRAGQNSVGSLHEIKYPAHGRFLIKKSGNHKMAVFDVSDKSKFIFSSFVGIDSTSELSYQIAGYIRNSIYNFSAQRLHLGDCPFGYNPVLKSNASNLPEVLNILQSNPVRFKRFNKFVRKIFPSIYQASVVPKQSNQLELLLWTEDPILERDDLAIELSESGTGVGQVLAILYVAISSSFPRIIIIDEPNSFLHPGAARKLIEILRINFPMHQYIISSHSAEVISAAKPNTIKLLRWEKPETVIDELSSNNLRDMNMCLSELGVRLSDVFGADNILWVEGETEEKCFQLILENLNEDVGKTVNIISLVKTGDFTNKKIPADRFFDIYQKLSNGNALMPPAIGFEFDRECRTDRVIDRLKQKASGKAYILPRRMYENYLLDVDAICFVLSRLETLKDELELKSMVTDWFNDNGLDKKYFNGASNSIELFSSDWYVEVDGAKLLSDLFQGLSDSKESFSKIIHSYEATEWLLNNKPGLIDELKEFVLSMLSSDSIAQ